MVISMANPGNSDQITREYFDSLLLEMRHIDGVKPDVKFELFGETFDTPIMMAALSHLNNTHPEGLAEQARGAKLANAVNWAGMGDKAELERITATGARTIKIIKPYESNEEIIDRIHHAEACGVLALGIDVDHAFSGNGEYDNIFGLSMRPKSLTEIKEFVQEAKVPFVIKGVLSTVDAEKCVEAGVKAIVISHHHGIMDYAVPPLVVLPEIVKAVDGQMDIFVDCGIVSGMDAYKALALGATAVCAGRVIMKPLNEKGAAGVKETIERITAELKGTMARTGCADLKHMDASVIRRIR